jgi:hypothetical protein
LEQVQSIEILKVRHAELENLLSTEGERPQPNQRVVAEMKREKLKIKDQIAEMER